MEVAVVFVAALGTAVATGLGALPLAGLRGAAERWAAPSGGLAGGFMTGASLGLLYEGGGRSIPATAIGALLGAAFVLVSARVLEHRHDLGIAGLKEADARRALAIIGVMTIHSVTEGVGVGVAFAGGHPFGALIAVAIALHNVPEGLAISLALVPQGVGVGRAALWSIFSSLPQPVMAVPAYLGVHLVTAALPWGLGFAAGAMLLMVAVYIIPEARASLSVAAVSGLTIAGAAAMLGAGFALGL